MKKIVLGVIALSILHSILFYAQDFGVSVVLFTICAMILIIYSLTSKNKVKNSKAFLLSIPITAISLTYAIFNNIFFNILNVFVIIGLTCIMIIWAICGEFNIKNIIVNTILIIFRPFGFIAEAVRVISENVFKRKQPQNGESVKGKITETKVFKQILTGLLISIPLLIIILALLISADTVFAQILEPIKEIIMSIFSFKFWTSLYFRILVFSCVCIYFMAFICNILKFDTEPNKNIQTKGIRMENITVNTVLTVLNIVYLLFSIIQFTYLFMQIGAKENLDYAIYARRGFFQLMIVTIINFVIILLTNANKRETTKFVSIYTKIMNLFLIIFTGIMICSSFLRMYLYEQEYGYTFLRLMVYFILATEFMLIIPTIAYIFSKKVKLLKSYIVIISIMYALVNFTNVDKTIAKKNVDKYITDTKMGSIEMEAEIDFKYLKKLSIDAIPDIIRLYENTEDVNLKSNIRMYLNKKYNKEVDCADRSNFQEFNYQRENAKNKLKIWHYKNI